MQVYPNYTEKHGIEKIFTHKLLEDFTSNYKEMISYTLTSKCNFVERLKYYYNLCFDKTCKFLQSTCKHVNIYIF